MVLPPFAPGEIRIINPSKGRVRSVQLGGGRIGFQDPDLVYQQMRPDGRIVTIRNVFISREPAIERLTFNFGTNRINDSLGQQVGVGNLGLPTTGRIAEYKIQTSTWMPLGVDPRRYRPAVNEEIIERVIFVDREGRLRVVRTSYGLGEKYDLSKYGGRWRSWASRALGLPEDERLTTEKLKKAQVSREFILKRTIPRG